VLSARSSAISAAASSHRGSFHAIAQVFAGRELVSAFIDKRWPGAADARDRDVANAMVRVAEA